MTPCDRLNAALEKLRETDCPIDPTVQRAVQEYEKQANAADQQLQEKQARERDERLK